MSRQWSSIRNIIAAGLTAALFLFLVSTAYAQCTNLGTDGLVAHWKLDETSGTTASDSAGTHGATMLSGLDAGNDNTTGPIDVALNFPETNDDATFPASASIKPDYITVAVWVKPDASSDCLTLGDCHIIRAADGGGWTDAWDLALREVAGELQISASAQTASQCCQIELHDDNPVPFGQWSHIAMTYDGSYIQTYLNGIPNGTKHAQPGVLNYNATTPGRIMDGAWEGDGELIGALDDIRIYNRALSTAEIEALYQQRSNDPPTAGTIGFNPKYAQMVYCDGTNWVNMGLGSYNPNAVNFDGANDYLTRGADLTGNTDSGKFTANFWFKVGNNAANKELITTANSRFTVRFTATEQLQILASNSVPTSVLSVVTTPTYADGKWHQALISIDMASTSTRLIYIDGAAPAVTWTTYTTASTIDFTDINYGIGATTAGGTKFIGDIANLWLDTGTYIDLSVEANRRKFISANGMPKYLGADGSLPTGSPPDIFLTGDTGNWHVNMGTGGGFTENGTLTTASSQPGDVLLAEEKWMQVGTGRAITVYYTALAALDSTEIAFIDSYNDQLRTYKWNGFHWSQVGNGLGIAGVTDQVALTALDNNTVAFIADGNDELRTYSWNGTDWSQVGNGLAIPMAGLSPRPALALLTSNTVAFIDSDNDQLRTYSWDGSDWSQVGNGLAIAGTGWLALAALDNNTVAFIDGNNDKLRTYSWDGSDWSQVGSDLAVSSIQTPALAAMDSNTVAFIDYFNDELRRYSWNGTDWSQAGNPLSVPDTQTPSLTALDSSTVAFIDYANDELRTYAISGKCRNPGRVKGTMVYNGDFNVMQYCNGVEWVAMGPVNNSLAGCLTIGELCLDGSIFAGDMDMYVTDVNQSAATQWKTANGTNDIAPDSSTNGQSNHDNRGAGTFPAFELCENLDRHGHQDWYLPAKDELNVLYLNSAAINASAAEDFTVSYYWSSTESTNSFAWYEYFTDGTQGGGFKTNSNDVRCVRRDDGSGAVGGSADCANPAMPPGSLIYNIDYSYLQYCNGENWIGIGK